MKINLKLATLLVFGFTGAKIPGAVPRSIASKISDTVVILLDSANTTRCAGLPCVLTLYLKFNSLFESVSDKRSITTQFLLVDRICVQHIYHNSKPRCQLRS